MANCYLDILNLITNPIVVAIISTKLFLMAVDDFFVNL